MTDRELVLRARSGDARAKEALFRRHTRTAHGLAYRLLGHDDEQEELVQDAFVEALADLGSLREPAAFSSWLQQIVVHLVRRRIRRRQLAAVIGIARHETVDLEAIAGRSVIETAVEMRLLRDRFDALDTEERTAVLLHRVEGYTLAELAAAMGRSLSTVKRRLASAEAKLG
jgi:RNA polymerase sigma-70 factor, ECF subfamily